MKTLYLDCGMGAAGDMLTGALLALVPDQAAILERLNQLGLPGVRITAEPSQKCGILGTHVKVLVSGEEEHSEDVALSSHHHDDAHRHEAGEHHCHGRFFHDEDGHAQDGGHFQEEACHHGNDSVHEGEEHHHLHESEEQDPLHEVGEHHHGEEHHHHHHHTTLAQVETYIQAMPLSEDVQQDIANVYHLIAEAESHAHGMPVEQIHFHEVGTMDAIMDVTAVCLLLHELHPDRIVASPVRTGYGQVRCAHGIMPVPAPATAWLLEGIPTYSGDIEGEMCTPTGAALLRYYVREFAWQPLMRVEKTGYGMGTKDFPAANCVRAFYGEELEFPAQAAGDTILELRCNIDDMTGEEIGYAAEQLQTAGARDVFTTPIAMKKNRPGILLTVICSPKDKEKMEAVIFRHTTTIGIRCTVCSRAVLEREEETRQTPLGTVRVKTSRGYGVVRRKPEYEDLRRIAEEQKLPLGEVRERIAAAAADAGEQ